MNLYTIEDFNPIPTDQFYMIEEFKALFALKYNATPGDTQGRARLKGHAEARFLYHYCDHKSEFAKYSKEDRLIESLLGAGLNENYTISPELQAAIDRYQSLKNSRNLRLLKSANNAIDKLSKYFDDIDFTKQHANGSLIYSQKQVIGNVANLIKILEGLDKLEEAVRKEEGEESGAKGDAEKGRQ